MVLQDRIEFHQLDVTNYKSIQAVTDKVLSGTHVWLDDSDNVQKYLKILLKKQVKKEDFHLSQVIFSHPAAWITPKNLTSEAKERLNLNLQWILD